MTNGGYQAEYLELTSEGKIATSSDATVKDRVKARFKLAIEDIPPFLHLYNSVKGNRLPANSVLEDSAIEFGIDKEDAKECVEIFIVNAKYLGILKLIASAERIIPLEQVLEELPTASDESLEDNKSSFSPGSKVEYSAQSEDEQDWEHTCFYISPIGNDGTEHREHADLFLGSIVEPALEEFKLKVIRADKIGKAGMITAQIIKYILKSKLVIADLSYHTLTRVIEVLWSGRCRLRQ